MCYKVEQFLAQQWWTRHYCLKMLKLEVNFLYRVVTKCYNSALSQGKLFNEGKQILNFLRMTKKTIKKKKKVFFEFDEFFR